MGRLVRGVVPWLMKVLYLAACWRTIKRANQCYEMMEFFLISLILKRSERREGFKV